MLFFPGACLTHYPRRDFKHAVNPDLWICGRVQDTQIMPIDPPTVKEVQLTLDTYPYARARSLKELLAIVGTCVLFAFLVSI